MSRSTYRIRRAFTLVELLVVLGIISLLVALLMPVLARAREQANRVKCAANLRSIGHTLTMYTQQYAAYPPAFLQLPTVAGGQWALWPVRLRAFLGGEQDVFYCPSQDERCEWKKGQVPPPLPGGEPARFATDIHARFGYEVGEPLLPLTRYFSYGYNHFGTHVGSRPPPHEHYKGLGLLIALDPSGRALRDTCELRAARVKVPSQMIAITDSDADGFYDFMVGPTGAGSNRVLPGRVHGGGANVLFCDGHVQWYPQKGLLVSGAAVPSEIPIRRMWNNDHRPFDW